MLQLTNCSIHNLRNITAYIPLGLLVGVAGVSGSGKSSIIADTLIPKLKEELKNRVINGDENKKTKPPLKHIPPEDSLRTPWWETNSVTQPEVKIFGTQHIKKCIIVDQKPIGRTRTSCPATYTGIFDRVRKMFADSPEAVAQGFTPGMFSVNAEGQCRKCKGDGVIHYHVGFNSLGTVPRIINGRIRKDLMDIYEI